LGGRQTAFFPTVGRRQRTLARVQRQPQRWIRFTWPFVFARSTSGSHSGAWSACSLLINPTNNNNKTNKKKKNKKNCREQAEEQHQKWQLNGDTITRLDVPETSTLRNMTFGMVQCCVCSESYRLLTRYRAADHVFGEAAKTEQLFDTMAKDIVSGTVNGINGTIFAYGQVIYRWLPPLKQANTDTSTLHRHRPARPTQ
jgi:hypothetical protein